MLPVPGARPLWHCSCCGGVGGGRLHCGIGDPRKEGVSQASAPHTPTRLVENIWFP